jgi:hypothetical protein
MSDPKFNRNQVRRAIRQMGDEYIFYLLDDAISLLSDAQLRDLIAPYMDPEQFVADDEKEDLLNEVLAFQRASLAGEYCEEPPTRRANWGENSRATISWIADFRRLLDRCVAESKSTSGAELCKAFEILFGLLDSLDDGTGEGMVFAEECGSWMVGVEWNRVMPAWFQVLAASTEASVFARCAETMIARRCHIEKAEMLALARSVEESMRDGRARED